MERSYFVLFNFLGEDEGVIVLHCENSKVRVLVSVVVVGWWCGWEVRVVKECFFFPLREKPKNALLQVPVPGTSTSTWYLVQYCQEDAAQFFFQMYSPVKRTVLSMKP